MIPQHQIHCISACLVKDTVLYRHNFSNRAGLVAV